MTGGRVTIAITVTAMGYVLQSDLVKLAEESQHPHTQYTGSTLTG